MPAPQERQGIGMLRREGRRPGARDAPVARRSTDAGHGSARATAVLDAWTAPGGPFAEAIVTDLRPSMRNGGGPACLRLRVPLTAAERASIRARVFVDGALADELERWVRRHYRDRLIPADLADPALPDESRRALDELMRLLGLPALFGFQQASG